ncbi:MAG: GAF domain-containing sensor histidine kinase [Frankiales bacterium]|nr:GAF domain-containing sensor histidine kinase [Frankiales bacterium]
MPFRALRGLVLPDDEAETATPERWEPESVALVVRLLVLLMCLVLSAVSQVSGEALLWFPLLILAAVIGTVGQRFRPLVGRLLRIVEAMIAAVAIVATFEPTSPLFPYLIAPTFAGGLLVGVTGAIVSPGFAALVLVSAFPFLHNTQNYGAAIGEWIVLAVAAGLLAAWVRRLLRPVDRVVPVDTSYAAAYRLLAQLRPVARQLSVGLDPGTIASGLLEELRAVSEFDRGGVFVRTGAGRLIPLAALGAARIDWDVDIADDGPFAEAWLSQRVQRLSRQLSGPPGSALVVPLVIGLRTFGLVGLEAENRRFGPADAERATTIAAETALRLETALLFDEVRGMATAEERRRVAREIHDGIAQELSYLGYFVDGLAAEAKSRSEPSEAQLLQLRSEITRIVSELRMSIFDLRSEVDVHGGLGAALSEYVRTVGRQSGLTVHLSLAESANRLPSETEAELLRIAQEAVTNARKHAEAENLWVTLSIDPPDALLRVEDDGRGLGRARIDSYGLQIMRERAARLRTEVRVENREPKGTAVEVRLGEGVPATLPETTEAFDGGEVPTR